MAERKSLAQGWEHKVWKANSLHYDKPYVLKTPRPYIVFTLNRFFNGIDTVRDELSRVTKEAAEYEVQIPETKVYHVPNKNSYVIAQEFIESDESVNIPEYLQAKGAEYLYLRYIATPENFVSRKDQVYLLDFTLGIFRFTEKIDQRLITTARRIVHKLRRSWTNKY